MKFPVILLALALFSLPALAQDQDKVLVPRNLLTQEQFDRATHSDLKAGVHEWVGLGREVGEAVNSSLSAITEQANLFAKTGVGKLTVLLVVWKVIGDQFVHIIFGLLELLIFLPLWIWSYRRTCMDRRVKIGKDQWQVVEYNRKNYADATPRIVHTFAIAAIVGVILFTVFSY